MNYFWMFFLTGAENEGVVEADSFFSIYFWKLSDLKLYNIDLIKIECWLGHIKLGINP